MKNITLTSDQQKRYAKYKVELPFKLLAVFDAGRMLAEIRDEELYKIDGHANFKVFCQEILKVNGSYAYRLIDAAKVKKESPMGDFIVNERQSRALRDVPIENHKAVVEMAQKTGELTAASIEKAKVIVAAPKGKPAIIYCETGCAIPTDLLPLWLRRAEAGKLLETVSELKCHVDASLKESDPLFGEVSNNLVAQLEQVYEGLKYLVPYALCSCNGHLRNKCVLCHGRGLVSKHKYELFKPELRQMRAKILANRRAREANGK